MLVRNEDSRVRLEPPSSYHAEVFFIIPAMLSLAALTIQSALLHEIVSDAAPPGAHLC